MSERERLSDDALRITAEHGLPGFKDVAAELLAARARIAALEGHVVGLRLEVDALEAERERYREALEKAVRLYETYEIIANGPAAGKWVNAARQVLKGISQERPVDLSDQPNIGDIQSPAVKHCECGRLIIHGCPHCDKPNYAAQKGNNG